MQHHDQTHAAHVAPSSPALMAHRRSFGIELEMFLLDPEGRPAFGATQRVLAAYAEQSDACPPVAELGSFQIELNPGPWALTDAGIDEAIDALERAVERLRTCARDLGYTLCTDALLPCISPLELASPALFHGSARSRATTRYFAASRAIAELADGRAVVFPGESVLACLNEIHIHVQLEDDAATLALFNAWNEEGDAIVAACRTPVALNGSVLAEGCTTMSLFAQADGELGRDGRLRRVGYLPYAISSYEEYASAVATFSPIPCEGDTYLDLPSSVWFWTRLRGEPGALRTEFRPMDMGTDWQRRVRHLAGAARRLADRKAGGTP